MLLETTQQVRVIQLEDKNLNDVVRRIEKDTLLQFTLSPLLYGSNITLFTNHPLSADVKFQRTTYYKIESTVDKQNEETTASILANVSGSFQYCFNKNGIIYLQL